MLPTTFIRRAALAACNILICVTLLTACGDGVDAPDVSDVKVELQTYRFDRDMAAIDTNNVAAGLEQLHTKYPEFTDFFLDKLMGFGIEHNYNDTTMAIREGLRVFLTYKDYKNLFDTIAVHFPDTKDADAALTKGFRFMKHYYPGYHVPKIIYVNTGLNRMNAFTYDTTIVGVSLDMFLGKGYPYYASVGIPDYVLPTLEPEYIPVYVFRTAYTYDHPFVPENKTLLDMMIQRGKQQYFLSKIIPFIPEHQRLFFSPEQLDWCQKNEALIYNFFVQQKFLYSTNWAEILRYVNDGPTAAGMAPESPGNVGSYIGLRIVEAYMERNAATPWQELLNKEIDAQQLLQQSKYKPKQ